MNRSQHDVALDQYGPRADAYVTSAVHANGADLDALEAIVSKLRPERVLDLGCGGGHVAYRMSPHAGKVVACDLSPDMIAAVAATAAARGLANLTTQVAPAERLPFEDDTFDFVASRFSAHHWQDWEAGLREARRVLTPGGRAVFIDAVSPGSPALDTHIQAIELLRDPSHVRNYSAAEWQAALVRAGFAITATVARPLPLDFQSWVDRMATPETLRVAVRTLQQAASAEKIAHFGIKPDGSFVLDTLQIEAVAA